MVEIKDGIKKKQILLIVTGSVAAYKAAIIASRLTKAGGMVKVVMTNHAKEFIGVATFEGLTGNSVFHDQYQDSKMMSHIQLTRESDLILIAPATANFINKAAHGIGDDLASTLLLSHKFDKPILLAPAMNTAMLDHPATQSSLLKLKSWGFEILESESGALACGEVGAGKMQEPEKIISAVLKKLNAPIGTRPLRGVITYGGTAEPLDSVRKITNSSTGKTGAKIAEYFQMKGVELVSLRAEGSPLVSGESYEFSDTESLKRQLIFILQERDLDFVIHAAAVSDYKVDHWEDQQGNHLASEKKIRSNYSELRVVLRPTDKLIDELRIQSKNKNIRIVAFKLTDSADEEERRTRVLELFERARVDLVVQNDVREIKSQRGHQVRLYFPKDLEKGAIVRAHPVSELASHLEGWLREGGGHDFGS